MNWIKILQMLRARREACVLVTLTGVRGHAPRNTGAKMVVTQHHEWATIGGGNLEASAVKRAREMLSTSSALQTETLALMLNDKASNEHGRQCCGGEVSILLELLPVPPAVAVFGLGHVGVELARILSRWDIELHVVDSREAQLAPARLGVLADAVADVHQHHSPIPELVLGELPAGTHIVVMTHDHAEDAALMDAALRLTSLGSIGLIGSSAKWRRFQKILGSEGHSPETLAMVHCPIGIPEITGKEPSTIALSVAASLRVQLDTSSIVPPKHYQIAQRTDQATS